MRQHKYLYTYQSDRCYWHGVKLNLKLIYLESSLLMYLGLHVRIYHIVYEIIYVMQTIHLDIVYI